MATFTISPGGTTRDAGAGYIRAEGLIVPDLISRAYRWIEFLLRARRLEQSTGPLHDRLEHVFVPPESGFLEAALGADLAWPPSEFSFLDFAIAILLAGIVIEHRKDFSDSRWWPGELIPRFAGQRPVTLRCRQGSYYSAYS